jgi:hypothetical protein
MSEQTSNPEVPQENPSPSTPQQKKPPKLNRKKPAGEEQQQPDIKAEDDQHQQDDQQEEDNNADEAAAPKQESESEAEDKPQPEPEPEPSPRRRNRRSRPTRRVQRYHDPEDTEEIARSDMDGQQGHQQAGRRNRTRSGPSKRQFQQQQAGGPLGGIGDVGNTVSGTTDMVQNTAGKAVNGVTDSAGKALGGVLGGGQKDEDGGKDEQLRLRLDLNLDIEVQLKAKIHGDLTLGLLYVFCSSRYLSLKH